MDSGVLGRCGDDGKKPIMTRYSFFMRSVLLHSFIVKQHLLKQGQHIADPDGGNIVAGKSAPWDSPWASPLSLPHSVLPTVVFHMLHASRDSG